MKRLNINKTITIIFTKDGRLVMPTNGDTYSLLEYDADKEYLTLPHYNNIMFTEEEMYRATLADFLAQREGTYAPIEGAFIPNPDSILDRGKYEPDEMIRDFWVPEINQMQKSALYHVGHMKLNPFDDDSTISVCFLVLGDSIDLSQLEGVEFFEPKDFQSKNDIDENILAHVNNRASRIVLEDSLQSIKDFSKDLSSCTIGTKKL